MATTRLTQIGIGGPAYAVDTVVSASLAEWVWEPFPATVSFVRSTTRLGQIGIGVAAYPSVDEHTVVDCSLAEWVWESFPATIVSTAVIPIDCTLAEWVWEAWPAQVCGPDPKGYAYSFNQHTFPRCTYNEYKYGPRTAVNVYAQTAEWGWETFPATVLYQADVTVNCGFAEWGWEAFAATVSLGLNVNCTFAEWGWEAFPATVTLAVDVECSLAEWGWEAFQASVSLGTTINCSLAEWGWEALPATIISPKFEINCGFAEWGWETFPADVDYRTLSDEDLDALYQKFIDQGDVQRWLETWRRQGADPDYPQDIPAAPGGYIDCGGMRIYVERMPDGKIRQTRQ